MKIPGFITWKLFFGISMVLLNLSTLAFGQGISVSPSRIFFKGQPGQTVSQSITFSNQSKNKFNFVSSIKDWDRDSLGVKKYYPMATLEASNANWISLEQSTLELDPGETKTVEVYLQIPEKSAPEQLSHSMLFFTQIKEKTKTGEQGLGIRVLLELGIQVYHVPQSLTPGALEFLTFQDRGEQLVKQDTIRQMAVKIKNTGGRNQDAYVRFELTELKTGAEISIPSRAVALLPQAEQWVYIALPADLKGRYLAVAILDSGRQYNLKVAEKEISY